MHISRRDAIRVSGATLAGLSIHTAVGDKALGQPAQAPAPETLPQQLVEQPLRMPSALPLNPDGSAPEYTPREAGTITEPTLWRFTKGEPPQIEFDYRKMKIKLEPGAFFWVAKLGGTLTFKDLEPLPRHSYVVLLQCGTPNPRGIVKWTGVRFRDFAEMIGLQPNAHYCRFVGSDRYFTDEEVKTLMHPQVVLAWLMNDAPIPPKHGAPLRLIIPFRYGARSMKAITEIYFGTPGLPARPLPV